MKRNIRTVPMLILALLFLASCVGKQVIPTDTSQMTPKQKASMFMSVYNKQYADYKVVAAQIEAAKLPADDPKRVVLREKKKALVEVYPIIQSYDMSVASGQPNASLEPLILSLLNRLEGTIK